MRFGTDKTSPAAVDLDFIINYFCAHDLFGLVLAYLIVHGPLSSLFRSPVQGIKAALPAAVFSVTHRRRTSSTYLGGVACGVLQWWVSNRGTEPDGISDLPACSISNPGAPQYARPC